MKISFRRICEQAYFVKEVSYYIECKRNLNKWVPQLSVKKKKYMETHVQMTEFVNERRMDVSICKFSLTTLKAPARTQLIMDDTVVGVKFWPYGKLGKLFRGNNKQTSERTATERS